MGTYWDGYLHGMGTLRTLTRGGGGGGWFRTGMGAHSGQVLTQENMAHVFTEHSMAYCVFQPVNSGENTACSPVFMLFVRLV